MLELIPYIIGLTQVFKKLGVPGNLLPFISIIIGALLNAQLTDWTVFQGVEGALIGLWSTGLVHFVDSRIEKAKMPPLPIKQSANENSL